MTTHAMNDFANAVRSDEAMARDLAVALEGREESDVPEVFTTFAQQRGFEVTADDVLAFQQSADGDGALSDDDLAAVSGAGLLFGPRPSLTQMLMPGITGALVGAVMGGVVGTTTGAASGFLNGMVPDADS
ncbi:hypothetical protein SAMN06297251_11292 [Fulvimarina manganoxydans]|uniref:Nif11-like leader peptide domain-containing protein n=1 Tax=Fulvimarina manganoxydans TaxID=937218 RepID=A0A1W2D2Z7_9HYPH|nr:hypothetical protein [Fulvimarina manganoxydans]SMC91945.1 hypothetical protein SAMN06297251_11292 [Fulvimarina manganoxydans]